MTREHANILPRGGGGEVTLLLVVEVLTWHVATVEKYIRPIHVYIYSMQGISIAVRRM